MLCDNPQTLKEDLKKCLKIGVYATCEPKMVLSLIEAKDELQKFAYLYGEVLNQRDTLATELKRVTGIFRG